VHHELVHGRSQELQDRTSWNLVTPTANCVPNVIIFFIKLSLQMYLYL
jgi:hypothetical protein